MIDCHRLIDGCSQAHDVDQQKANVKYRLGFVILRKENDDWIQKNDNVYHVTYKTAYVADLHETVCLFG